MVSTAQPGSYSAQRGSLLPLGRWTVLALVFVVGAIGALADTAVGQNVGVLFTVGFSAAAVLGVLLVDRRLLWGTVLELPLVYLLLLVVGAVTGGRGGVLAWLTLAYIFKAPTVLIGTGAAAAAAALRAGSGR